MALNKVLGSFKPDNLLAANQELPAVADTLEIAAGQFLLRGSLVNKDGVLVNANDMEVYAVLARACDTTDGAKEAPVYLTGEFNTDAVKMNENVDNKFAVCVAARHAGIFLKPHVKMPPCAPMTLRFKFSKPGYVPSSEKGTWKKVVDGIWDWTREDPDWNHCFANQWTTADLKAEIIASGDLSSVINISQLFSHCSSLAGTIELDFPNVDKATEAFILTSIEYVKSLKLPQTTNINQLFARTYKLKRIDDIYFGDDPTIAVQAYALCGCVSSSKGSLESIGTIHNVSALTDAQLMFQHQPNLKRIEQDVLDFTNAKTLTAIFNGCYEIENIPEIVTSEKLQSAQGMFASCKQIKSVNRFYTNSVTDFGNMFLNANKLEDLPVFDYTSITKCGSMFRNTYSAKTGILENYHALLAHESAITDHSRCFENCGRDTEEGQAALAQIPASWGGLAEG